MRGKRPGAYAWAYSSRNIPAYAGKTRRVASVTMLVSEHPRVCGENLDFVHHAEKPCGTSPRMRGKQGLIWWIMVVLRNIPAYAGKTRC